MNDGEEMMRQFVKKWIILHYQKSATWIDFVVFYIDFCKDNFNKEASEFLIENMDWYSWILDPNHADIPY